jgi:hypothetical protein
MNLNRMPLATHEYEPTMLNESPNRKTLGTYRFQGGGITAAELANVGPNSIRPGKNQQDHLHVKQAKVAGDTADEIRMTTDILGPSPEFQK